MGDQLMIVALILAMPLLKNDLRFSHKLDAPAEMLPQSAIKNCLIGP